MTSIALVSTRPRSAAWTGRILSGLGVAFMLFDAGLHLVKPEFVVKAFDQMNYPAAASQPIGVLALIGVLLYLRPRTSVLGAVMLTGYLGGAIAVQVGVRAVPFNLVFPVLIASLFWGGLVLRDRRVIERILPPAE